MRHTNKYSIATRITVFSHSKGMLFTQIPKQRAREIIMSKNEWTSRKREEEKNKLANAHTHEKKSSSNGGKQNHTDWSAMAKAAKKKEKSTTVITAMAAATTAKNSNYYCIINTRAPFISILNFGLGPCRFHIAARLYFISVSCDAASLSFFSARPLPLFLYNLSSNKYTQTHQVTNKKREQQQEIRCFVSRSGWLF